MKNTPKFYDPEQQGTSCSAVRHIEVGVVAVDKYRNFVFNPNWSGRTIIMESL